VEPDGSSGGTVGVHVTYNARGLRDTFAVTSTSGMSYTEQFHYQGERVSKVDVSGPATFTESFIYRPDGQPLELLYQQPLQPTQRYWYVLNLQGDVVGLSDASGALVNQDAYDPWGASDPLVSVAPQTSETILQPLRYRGYWYDGWYNGSTNGSLAPHLHGAASGALRPGTHLQSPASLGPLARRMGLSVGEWRALPASLRALYSRLLARAAHARRAGHIGHLAPIAHRQRGRGLRPHLAHNSNGTNAGPLQWYWLTSRYCDPLLRRFLQPDPSSRDGVRSYVYCHDDPANCSDPSGLEGGEDLPTEPVGPDGEPAANAEPPSKAPSGPIVADTSPWGPDIPYQDTLDAVSEELGSKPIATLGFEDRWQKTVPETDPFDKFIYVIFDSETDVIMKPGQTAGSKFRLIRRFGDYAYATKMLRLTSRLRLSLWRVSAGYGTELDAIENRVRALLEEMGHRLPWENDRVQRLGRPLSGVPFTRGDFRGSWTDNPKSPNHGQVFNRISGGYYQPDPPYYPPWTPDAVE
jgi:RHS repeat-associated protein